MPKKSINNADFNEAMFKYLVDKGYKNLLKRLHKDGRAIIARMVHEQVGCPALNQRLKNFSPGDTFHFTISFDIPVPKQWPPKWLE